MPRNEGEYLSIDFESKSKYLISPIVISAENIEALTNYIFEVSDLSYGILDRHLFCKENIVSTLKYLLENTSVNAMQSTYRKPWDLCFPFVRFYSKLPSPNNFIFVSPHDKFEPVYFDIEHHQNQKLPQYKKMGSHKVYSTDIFAFEIDWKYNEMCKPGFLMDIENSKNHWMFINEIEQFYYLRNVRAAKKRSNIVSDINELRLRGHHWRKPTCENPNKKPLNN